MKSDISVLTFATLIAFGALASSDLTLAAPLSRPIAGPLVAQRHDAIIGGTVVTAQNWIAQTVVALTATSDEGEALCTASLVAKDLAVTAAHCVTPSSPSHPAVLTLLFGKNIHSVDANHTRLVDRVEVPAEWNPHASAATDTSDVALVHFTGGLPLGYSASDLLPFDQTLSAGQSVELAGYGISNASADAGAGILRKTQVKIANPHYSVSEVQLDQSQGGSACHGDSGGPAYVVISNHPYLFGITSRGGGNCDEDVIYTEISAYADWFTQASAVLRH